MQLDKVKRRTCTETASLLGHSLNHYGDLSPFYLIIYLVADKSISVVSDHYLPHYSYIDFFIDKKKVPTDYRISLYRTNAFPNVPLRTC